MSVTYWEEEKPKKNGKPNGFVLFTLDWISKQDYVCNMKLAMVTTGTLWKSADAETRAYFINKAKEINNQDDGDKSFKCCNGVPLARILKEKQDSEQFEMQMKQDIENEIKEAIDAGQLLAKTFIVIHCNFFTCTLHGGFYIPAEFGAVEFSLGDAITRTYHSLISPCISLFGEQHNAQVHSEETHRLPSPPNAIGEPNLSHIYNKLVEFATDSNGYVRPLYTKECDMKMVENALNLIKNAYDVDEVVFNIYSLEHLMKSLKNYPIIENPVINSDISSLFDRADYGKSKITCKFHSDIGVIETCSSSIAYTWTSTLYRFIFPDENDLSTSFNMSNSRSLMRGRGRGRGHQRSSTYPTLNFGSNVKIAAQRSLHELETMFSHLNNNESTPPTAVSGDADSNHGRGRSRGRGRGRGSSIQDTILVNDKICNNNFSENLAAERDNDADIAIKSYTQCLRGRGPIRCVGFYNDENLNKIHETAAPNAKSSNNNLTVKQVLEPGGGTLNEQFVDKSFKNYRQRLRGGLGRARFMEYYSETSLNAYIENPAIASKSDCDDIKNKGEEILSFQSNDEPSCSTQNKYEFHRFSQERKVLASVHTAEMFSKDENADD